MRIEGQFIAWDDQRKFGFIKPLRGGEDVLVGDISFEPGAERPQIGGAVTFEIELSARGRKRAKKVRRLTPQEATSPAASTQTSATSESAAAPTSSPSSASSSVPRPHRYHPAREPASRSNRSGRKSDWNVPAVAAIPVLLLCYLAANLIWSLPRWGWLWFVVTSALSYVYYQRDKRAADEDEDRVPENNLHVLALLGGWPGALIAQRTLRHKLRKPAFMKLFWLTVIGNLILLFAFAAVHRYVIAPKPVVVICPTVPC